MSSKFFMDKMKLADIIATNHNLILIMPRMGIALGFGDKSVAKVCEESGVPADFVVMMCNVYTFDDYLPLHPTFEEVNMMPLIPYLRLSHHYYLEERLPHIEHHLEEVVEHMEPRYAEVLRGFMADYKAEVSAHFMEEEQQVFPLLQRLQQGERNNGTMQRLFVGEHTSIFDKLSDLTQIIYKYLPADVMSEVCIELVFDILQLSADLEKHAMVEEKVLLPYAEWLERREA